MDLNNSKNSLNSDPSTQESLEELRKASSEKKKQLHKSKKRKRKELPDVSDSDFAKKYPKLYEKVQNIKLKPNPLETSSFLSKLLVTYVNPLINLTQKVRPDIETNYKLPSKDKVDYNQALLEEYFYNRKKGMIYSFFACFKWGNFISISLAAILGVM